MVRVVAATPMPKCDNWMHEDSKKRHLPRRPHGGRPVLWLQLQFLLCQQPTDALDIWFSLQTVVFSSPVLIDPMTRRIRDMSNNFEHFFARGVGV